VLVYDVANRGSKLIFALLDDAPADSTAAAKRSEGRQRSRDLLFSLTRL